MGLDLQGKGHHETRFPSSVVPWILSPVYHLQEGLTESLVISLLCEGLVNGH